VLFEERWIGTIDDGFRIGHGISRRQVK
jgi:hypothetical protein